MTNQRAFMNATIMAAIHGDILQMCELDKIFCIITRAVSNGELEEEEDDLTISLHSMLGNLSPEEKVQAANMLSDKFFVCAATDPMEPRKRRNIPKNKPMPDPFDWNKEDDSDE